MDFAALKTTTRRVQFAIHAMKVTDTGFFLTLRYESSPEVQAVRKKFDAMMGDESRKGRKADFQGPLDWFRRERTIAHVAGWEWLKNSEGKQASFNGDTPEFSPEKLREILKGGSEFAYHLRNFIDEEIGDAEDFLDKSVRPLGE